MEKTNPSKNRNKKEIAPHKKSVKTARSRGEEKSLEVKKKPNKKKHLRNPSSSQRLVKTANFCLREDR
jgi:hypothetical protein